MATEKQAEEPEVKSLAQKESMYFPDDLDCVKLLIEWISKQQGIICDLDLNLYCYDERARLTEKIDAVNKVSKDASCLLIKEIESNESSNSHIECFKFDSKLVDPSTTAILLYLDGGPRNFQFLQAVNIQCSRVVADRSYGDFLPTEDNNNSKNGPLFKIAARTRKNYQGLALCVLYKDGWNEAADCPRWSVRSFMEPLFVTSTKDKQEKLGLLVVGAVPALEKFRPRLFGSIMDICAALSSHSLPKLKKKFQKGDGLPIGQFTEVLFKQLYETHPRIIEDMEAPYTVAMLQEMFYQIDYNGDGTTNWDEFTSFCVQTGLSVNTNKTADNKNFSLEQYVIEYAEAHLERDRVLSAYRFISLMRYVNETRKIVVISEDADNVMIFDEDFKLYTQLYPSKVQVIGNFSKDTPNESKTDKNLKTSGFPRVVIYDIIYLSGREMYCYTSSDHCMTICKEFSSMGGKKVNFQQHNRFYHNLLHLKLCWSQKHDLLCSVASDRVIYGWNIDTGGILFQVSRHTDIITDFICCDHLDLFMTCSMDKRIVLWSAVSRRVKGILLGHKRGVRNLSVYDQTLLSAGFESEARLWELVNKDCTAILKGHRHPIVNAQLMCDKAQSEKEHRAITVDESGEFRLWNIYIRERSSEPVLLPTLQIFEMSHPEIPINQFRFLAIPYNPNASTSYYSDFIACSTKLLHFIPEKNVKEFIAPTACVFNEAGSSVITAYGKTVILYDVSTGEFSNVYEDMVSHEISAICLDGERGRKMFLGTSIGELMLVNTTTGMVIDSVHYHNKEITSLCEKNKGRSCVYSASMDGHLRLYEESNGKLHLHHSLENAFGPGIGITRIKSVPSLSLIVATGTGNQWGVFHDTSMKKLFVVHQEEAVTAFEIIGASRDKADEEHKVAMNYSPAELFAFEKETLLTLALATASGVVIYTMCSEDFRGVKTWEFLHENQLYITDLVMIKSPDINSVNYSSVRSAITEGPPGYHLVAVGDDGALVVWDMGQLRFQSEAKYRKHYEGVPRRAQALIQSPKAKAPPKHVQEGADKDNRSVHSGHSKRAAGSPTARERRKQSPSKVFLTADDSADHHPDRLHHDHHGHHGHHAGGHHGDHHGHHGHGAHHPHHQDDHHGSRGHSRGDVRRQSHAHAHHDNSHHGHHGHHNGHHDAHGHGQHHDGEHSHPSSHHGNRHHPDEHLHPHPDNHHGDHHEHGHGHHHGEGYHYGHHGGAHHGHEHHGVDHHHHHPDNHLHGHHDSHHGHHGHHDGHHGHHGHHDGHHGHHDGHHGHHDGHHGHHGHGHSGSGHRHDTHSTTTAAGAGAARSTPAHPAALAHTGRAKTEGGTTWVELQSAAMFPLPKGSKFPSFLKAFRSWQAHSDSIPVLVPMHAHGCLLTMSLDGYHRVWNLDKQCLGELALPNLTDQMKANSLCKEPGTGWRFILERIPVTKHHMDIAAVLVKFLKQTRQEKAAEHAADSRRQFNNLPVGFKGFREQQEDQGDPEASAQAALRKSILQALVEPPKPSEDIPPARLPTKEEKELIKLSLSLENLRLQQQAQAAQQQQQAQDGSLVLGEMGTNSYLSAVPSTSSKKLAPLLSPQKGSRTPDKRGRSGRAGSPSQNSTRKNVRSKSPVAPVVNSSQFFGGDNSVLMSSFGGPSLWSVPGEKDIFGNSSMVLHSNAPEIPVPPAFSEASLKNLRRDNLIDVEGQRILRKLAQSSDRVQVYDRSQPTLLVRSPSMSTSVVLPSLDSMRRTEIAFGSQKDMYKNAEKVLNDRDNISKSQVRNAVAKARIELNVRKISSMIHLIQPPSHDEVILPKSKSSGGADGEEDSPLDSEEMQKLRSEEQKMKIRLMKSAALVPPDARIRPLDRKSIDRWVSKMNSAIEPFGDNKPRESTQKRKKKEQLSQAAIHVVEKKLQMAIRGEYRARMARGRRMASASKEGGEADPDEDYDDDGDEDGGDDQSTSVAGSTEGAAAAAAAGGKGHKKGDKKPVLTTRMLLPYYKLEAVHQFMDIFAKVDENFSGDLDVNEWIRLFTSLNESVPVLEARMIFMKIDKDSDGFLTMRELIPVVFNKATQEQKRAIIAYAEMELTKKIETESVPKVTAADLEFLFEAYDTENIGFVDVALIKERVRTFYLSEQALFHFMDSISDLADDEMVSVVEFKRLFRLYMTTKDKNSGGNTV